MAKLALGPILGLTLKDYQCVNYFLTAEINDSNFPVAVIKLMWLGVLNHIVIVESNLAKIA